MDDSSHDDTSKQGADSYPGAGAKGDGSDPWRVDGGELFTGVGAICDTAARLTGVDGAAVAVLTPSHGGRELVYATDALAQQIDELQFILGEGPCLDAYQGDRSQLCAQLTDEVFMLRWPAFTSELAELGVTAVFVYPIPGARHPWGVLELYRRTGGDLDEREQQSAQLCAAALRDRLASNWRTQVSHSASEDAAVEAAALRGAAVASSDPFTRSQVYVAAGMLAVQLGVSTHDALDRLRAYSYTHKRSIVALAAEVVERRLSFRDLNDSQGADS